MLSHDESRRLEEIERHLLDNDPVLARRFATWSLPRDWGWLAILLFGIGVIGAAVGTLTMDAATILILGFMPVAAGMALWSYRPS